MESWPGAIRSLLRTVLYTRTYGFSNVPLKRQLNTTVAASFHPNQPGSLAELNDVSKSLDKHAV
jgi:hypothetical protein